MNRVKVSVHLLQLTEAESYHLQLPVSAAYMLYNYRILTCE